MLLCDSFITMSIYNITFVVLIGQTDLSTREFLLFIDPGAIRTCFEIEAIDDTIAEGTEVVNVTVIPQTPGDSVMDGVVSVAIMDNDGM